LGLVGRDLVDGLRAPDGVLTTSLVRARFCEQLAKTALSRGQEFDAFLAGMLSLMDAIMGRPLPDILREIGVSQEVTEALTEADSGALGTLLQLCRAYEFGAWEELDALSGTLGLREDSVRSSYLNAIAWTRQTLAQS